MVKILLNGWAYARAYGSDERAQLPWRPSSTSTIANVHTAA